MKEESGCGYKQISQTTNNNEIKKRKKEIRKGGKKVNQKSRMGKISWKGAVGVRTCKRNENLVVDTHTQILKTKNNTMKKADIEESGCGV